MTNNRVGGGNGGRPMLSKYRTALSAISARTGTALPSLVTSFAVLHEVTAVIPFAGLFFGARALGLGERVIGTVASRNAQEESGWLQRKFLGWMDEGEHWAIRVGRRYGIWGFEKGQRLNAEEERAVARNIAGDLANAVVAYGATKALLPLRVGLSLYLAPAFSRRVVDPVGRFVMRGVAWRRRPP